MENASKCCRNTLPDTRDNFAFSGIFLGKGNIVLIKIIVFFSLEFLITAIYVVRGVSLILFFGRKRPKFSKYAGKGINVALEKLYTLPIISGSVSLCVRALFKISFLAVLKPGLMR